MIFDLRFSDLRLFEIYSQKLSGLRFSDLRLFEIYSRKLSVLRFVITICLLEFRIYDLCVIHYESPDLFQIFE